MVIAPPELPNLPTVHDPVCDPNYDLACVPVSTVDVDCADLPTKNFRVKGVDIHSLDGDGDGIACE
jgi:hypothetical protein